MEGRGKTAETNAKAGRGIYGIPKWQLLDCTAKTREAPHPKLPGKTIRVPDSGEDVMIDGRNIEVKRVAKFLGILIDAALTWKFHQRGSVGSELRDPSQFNRPSEFPTVAPSSSSNQ